jgi:hypothetical protein
MERIDFACSCVTFILPSRWICFVTDPGFGACSRFSSGASPFAGKIKVLLCFGCCRFWIKVVPLVVDFSFGQALRQQFGFPLACHCIQDFPKFFLLGSLSARRSPREQCVRAVSSLVLCPARPVFIFCSGQGLSSCD